MGQDRSATGPVASKLVLAVCLLALAARLSVGGWLQAMSAPIFKG
jgi:hypothetical protein